MVIECVCVCANCGVYRGEKMVETRSAILPQRWSAPLCCGGLFSARALPNSRQGGAAMSYDRRERWRPSASTTVSVYLATALSMEPPERSAKRDGAL